MEREAIDRFFAQSSFVVLGASRSGTKFGNMVVKELSDKGLTVYQVNPEADEIAGRPCYRSLSALPQTPGSAIVSVSSERALAAVQEAYDAGIRNIWLQQGISSPEALRFCEEKGVNVVSGRCVMMFAEPVDSIHKFHRGLAKLFGRYPRAATA